MAKKVRVLFVCGTGIATSTAAENKCQTALTKLGYTVTTSQCIAQAVVSKAQSFNPHAIILTTKIPITKKDLGDGKSMFVINGIEDIPAFNGVPFLTGVGEDDLVHRIAEAVESSDKS